MRFTALRSRCEVGRRRSDSSCSPCLARTASARSVFNFQAPKAATNPDLASTKIKSFHNGLQLRCTTRRVWRATAELWCSRHGCAAYCSAAEHSRRGSICAGHQTGSRPARTARSRSRARKRRARRQGRKHRAAWRQQQKSRAGSRQRQQEHRARPRADPREHVGHPTADEGGSVPHYLRGRHGQRGARGRGD